MTSLITSSDIDMFQDILEYFETYTTVKPTESYTEKVWRKEINEVFDSIELKEETLTVKDELANLVASFYKQAKALSDKAHHGKRKRCEEILAAPQTEQRTDAWYEQMIALLTGSQAADILAGGRTYAKLVMSKARPEPQPTRRLVCLASDLNPFDWGIKFEPIAKKLYERICSSSVREVGRLVHKRGELRLAASPDGIVVEGARHGRLVEFKAPISRIVEDNNIPKKYWIQMQIQEEVSDIDLCDYFEIVLRSKCRSDQMVEGPCQYYGYVKVIANIETGELLRYFYADSADEEPMLGENEAVVETTEWGLLCYTLQTVQRSREWFRDVFEPKLIKFWQDVKEAEDGRFEMPPPAKRSTPKLTFCMIQDEIAELSIDAQDEVMVGR